MIKKKKNKKNNRKFLILNSQQAVNCTELEILQTTFNGISSITLQLITSIT